MGDVPGTGDKKRRGGTDEAVVSYDGNAVSGYGSDYDTGVFFYVNSRDYRRRYRDGAENDGDGVTTSC